jgi:thiol-disulfide isomerase/thioredoxin
MLLLALAVPAGRAAGGPEAEAEPVPKSVFRQIDAKLIAPSGISDPDRLVEAFKAQLHEALQIAAQAEMQHPDAPNLYVLREKMLLIADVLQIELKDPTAQKTKNAVARRIVESDAPARSRYAADQILLADKVGSLPRKQIRPELLKFVVRYIDTSQEVPAKLYILALAEQYGAQKLRTNLLNNLQAAHAEAPGVKAVLRLAGRGPDIGKPFDITLTKIDGTQLEMPEDLAGKVVVVDFWATWVPDAASFAQRLGKIRKTFPPEKVAILGINLDKQSHKDRVKQFIKNNDLDWIQTFSGRYTRDPAARKFGLFAPDARILTLVPSHWVLLPDGTIFSDEAIETPEHPGRLEKTIRKALQAAEKDAEDKPEPAK